MKFDVATPYTAVFVILRRGNTVAFVLRSDTGWMDGYYGLPSGKVEHNEPMSIAAVREAQEEIGVTIASSDLRHVLTEHRNGADDGTLWVDLYFEVSNWEGEPYNAEPDKHSELAWLDMHNLPDNIIPSVKYSLEQIAAGTTYAEFGWDATQHA